MKKISIIAASVLLLTAIVGFINIKSNFTKPVNKNINVEVYKEASYVSPAYADSYATLQVTVIKINGTKKDTAWQHSFAPKQLKDFPAANKPLLQKIMIPNVNDSKERLEIYYKLTYNTHGSELNFSNGAIIEKGEQTGRLHIKI